MIKSHDKLAVLTEASRRWTDEIFPSFGLPHEIMDGHHHPCPKCGGTDRFRLIDSQAGACLCNQCLTSKNGDGLAVLQWWTGQSFSEVVNEVGDRLHLDRSDRPRTSKLAPKDAEKPSDRLTNEIAQLRHEIYSLLAKENGLSPSHHEALEQRGLSKAEIANRGYWSAPTKTQAFIAQKIRSKFGLETVRDNVPGVLPGGKLGISYCEGLMIPVRDLDGRIIALQYRKDFAEGDRYRIFTSKTKQHPDRCSPGTPCHFAGVESPAEPSILRVTEGPLKGDVAAALTGVPTLGILGVNSWRKCLECIDAVKPKTLLIAMDADAKTNPAVAAAIVQIWDHYLDHANHGFDLMLAIETWKTGEKNGEFQPKGIDDALAANVPIERLFLNDAGDFVKRLRKVAAKSLSVSKGEIGRLRNYRVAKIHDENGEEKFSKEPLTVPEMAASLATLNDGWPKSCDGSLFVPDRDSFRVLKNHQSLFGWIASKSPAEFTTKNGAPGKQEFFAELPHHVESYEAIETYPHFPPITGHFYASQPTPTNGDALAKFVEFFCPATDMDRELIVAMIATTFWGGPPGKRPAFGVDSISGTGAGKTTLVSKIASLSGGCYEIGTKTDEKDLRSKLVNGETYRVALIDNIKQSRLSSETIESLITSPVISGHRMYHGNGSRPNTMTWAFTMNGLSLSRDLSERTITIKIGSPDRRGTWDEEIDSFIAANRCEVIASIAAFFERPAGTLKRFTRWAPWERAILSRLPEPDRLQQFIRLTADESDEDMHTAKALCDVIEMKLRELQMTEVVDVNGEEREVAKSSVHIPSKVAAQWLEDATGRNFSANQATAIIKSLIDSGSLRLLQENPSRKNGRGWIWRENKKNEAIDYELKTKILQQEFFRFDGGRRGHARDA